MFVGIPPLLDILHCYFLHGAAWHGLRPGLSASVRQKQKRFLVVGSQERWDPLEKSLHGDASLLIRRSLRSPRCASLLNVATSDFLSSIRARTRQEFRSTPPPRFFLLLLSPLKSVGGRPRPAEVLPASPPSLSQLWGCDSDQPSASQRNHRAGRSPGLDRLAVSRCVKSLGHNKSKLWK